MDNRVIDDFISIINPSVVDKLKLRVHVKSYKRSLNHRYANFIERVTNNYFELSEKADKAQHYLRKVREKLQNHQDILFSTQDRIIYYAEIKSLVVLPVQENNIQSELANIQYYYLNKAINYLTKQLSETIYPDSLQKSSPKKIIEKEALGFRIKNPTNLLSAWRLLRKKTNKFIFNDKTSKDYDIFYNNFTGKRIKRKITWIAADRCLYYFINGIYGKRGNYGLGVEIEENGQWNKASDCFCKEDGTMYDLGNLSRTKDPSKAQQDKLKIIIAKMNKQPKKRN